MNPMPLWKDTTDGSMGAVAISYAAGDDVKLDTQFIPYECEVNMAHVCMLVKQHLIPISVGKKLLSGLQKILQEARKGTYLLDPALEDVHSNIEQTLISMYGIEVGGYVRLGIARNDQVYTDTRLWMRDHIHVLIGQLIELTEAVEQIASKHTKTIMPGYTHLRISQPITYGHWLMAKAFHFLDDIHALFYIYDQVNACPLGIFEMAGTHLAIDRQYTAKLLGFTQSTPHSLYTANQRGEQEYTLLSALSMLALHIRRTMNELILFSGHEFGLISLGSSYVTGGTAQPNLTNPDTLEVIRAHMARIHAASLETAMIMDSLPSGFNRDTQVTKTILFDSVFLMEKTLPVVSGILKSCVPNKKRMEELANTNYATAPDMANQLSVCGGVSFREAYSVVKAIIKKGTISAFISLTPQMVEDISLELLHKPIRVTGAQIKVISTARASVMSHISYGGPAPHQVKNMSKKIQKERKVVQGKVKEQQKRKAVAHEQLLAEIQRIMKVRSEILG